MLEDVTWGEFLNSLGIILLVYYCYVLIRYFRSDVSGFLKKGKSKGWVGRVGSRTTKHAPSAMDKLSALLTEIDAELISNAGSSDELIQLLRQKINRYGLPDSTAGRKILISHVLLTAKAVQVELSEKELLNLVSELSN